LETQEPLIYVEPQSPQRKGKERKTTMSHDAAERVAIVLLGELCAARRRVNPQNRKLDGKANLVEFIGRLREGTTPEDLRHVIAVMEARAKADPFWADNFDAITPFRKKNIGKHLGIGVEEAGRARRQGGHVPQPEKRSNDLLARLTRGQR